MKLRQTAPKNVNKIIEENVSNLKPKVPVKV